MITFTVAILILILGAKCQDGFTDENRPYKFGFNIEGYQHRYEEKNEKGIIMGEYGFITADGVYHLTVYATDENGNFKILKMKNIKIGLPMMTTTTPIPGIAEKRPEKVREIIQNKNPEVIKLNGKPACGGCLVPEKENFKIQPIRGQTETINKIGISEMNKIMEIISSNEKIKNLPKNDLNIETLDPDRKKNFESKNDILSQQKEEKMKENAKNPLKIQNVEKPSVLRSDKKELPKDNKKNFASKNDIFQQKEEKIKDNTQNPLQIQNVEKPSVLRSDKKELQENLSSRYKFNYTLTFHGHEETGNELGEKKGSYFVHGRDGYRREITYEANQFGYQPKISLLKIDPQQTPQEKTEKELTKLLGNEFVWFYNKK